MDQIILLVLIGFLIGVYGAYVVATIRVKNPLPSGRLKGRTYPRVSILKPLKDMDDEIQQNIESFFQIHYPDYEIIFAVDQMTDPVVKILEKIKLQYPRIPCRIISTGHCSRYNPKVHKLMAMEKQADGDLFWITDSNIRAGSGILIQLVNEYLLRGSKLIFSPIHATGGRTIGSIIENAYINLFLSGNVILAWKCFKQHLIVGKSILFEKKTLAHLGGFSYFRDYLAEDFMMGEIYRACHFPIATNYVWVTTINSHTRIGGFWKRMNRWAKLRYRLKPHFYILEILLNPVPLLLGSWWVFPYPAVLTATTLILMGKILLELINHRFVNRERGVRLATTLLLPLLIILKDLILFFSYFTPFFSDTVEWRGGKITIGPHTLITSTQEVLQLEGA